MVAIHTCTNGVRIVSEQIPYVRSVSVGIWVDAGSRYELPEENGITHFIEHMLFKGTSSRTARQIAEEFDRIGGELNAFTSKENTCYYAKVLDHHAELAVTILADMFFNSTFDTAELEKERQVVLEEILMSEDAPDDDIHEILWGVMYPDDALGKPILGHAKTLKTFTANTIRNYMAKHYGPNSVVISVAGNVSEELMSIIESLFGHYQASSSAVDPVVTYPTFHSGRIVKKRDTEQSHIAISYPAIGVKDPDAFSFVALNNIIGGNLSSRLFQEVREEKGLAYSIYSYDTSYADVGAFTIYGSTSNHQLDKLHQTINEVIARIVEGGVTEEELHNAKEQLKGSFVLSLESTESHMNRNGQIELLHRKHRSVDEILTDVDAVSMESIDRLIQTMFTVDPAVVIIGPGVE